VLFSAYEFEASTVLAVMNPVACLLFILLSLSFLLLQNLNKKNILLLKGIALFVILIGIGEGVHLILRQHIDINNSLLPYKHYSLKGFMAPNSVLNFVLLGFAIINITTSGKKNLSDYLALISGFIGSLSFIGHLYNAPQFYQIAFPPMSLSSAMCFLLLSLNVIIIPKNEGILNEVVSPCGGKQIAKIILPAALLVPISGYLIIKGVEAGFYTVSFGIALFTMLSLTILFSSIWILSKSINRINSSLIEEIKIRKKIESELNSNNVFLNTILEYIPNMVYVKEPKKLNYIKINKAAEQFLKIKREDIIDKNNSDFLTPEDATFFLNVDRETIDKGEIIHLAEAKITVGEGEEKWINTKKIPVKDATGNVLYIVCISEDVTERKKEKDRIINFNKELEEKVQERTAELLKSENRFKALIENGIDVIVMTDENGVVTYVSPSVKKYIGYSDAEIINAWGPSFVHPDDREAALKFMQQVCTEPGVPLPHRIRMIHKDGHFIWVEGTIINKLHEENVNALVCNYSDITERVEAEDEKKRVEQALTEEKINRQKQILQATIEGQERERTRIGMELHDNINQILGATILYLGAAKRNPHMVEEMINKVSKNITLSINEIKKLSKALVTPKMHTYGFCHSLIDLVDSVQKSTDLQFNINSPDELLSEISHKTQLALYRVIQEQINNIIKHATAKNVFIAITKEKDMLELIIEDDGKGFDPSATRLGIGLDNIQNRIEALSGTLQIISEPNKGSKLIISVPFE